MDFQPLNRQQDSIESDIAVTKGAFDLKGFPPQADSLFTPTKQHEFESLNS